MTYYISYLIPISYISIFILGLLVGYYLKQTNTNGVSIDRPKSFFDSSKEDKLVTKIDDTKYVVSIGTDKLEKKYESLGETVQSDSTIHSAIDKLKNLKR